MEKGAKPVVFDIPRLDVDLETDWVFNINKIICEQLDIQYVAAHTYFDKPVSNYFRDGIHTNSKGAIKLASVLEDNIAQAVCDRFNPSIELLPSQIRNIHLYINKVSTNSDNSVEFSRSGYIGIFQSLEPNVTFELAMSNSEYCQGAFYLMGPETGRFQLDFGSASKTITALDPHCYYRRVGVAYFSKVQLGTKLLITSHSVRPDIKLIKGELSHSTVNNFIGGLLCSNIEDIDLLAKELKSLIV
jgi:hypothetical protein